MYRTYHGFEQLFSSKLDYFVIRNALPPIFYSRAEPYADKKETLDVLRLLRTDPFCRELHHYIPMNRIFLWNYQFCKDHSFFSKVINGHVSRTCQVNKSQKIDSLEILLDQSIFQKTQKNIFFAFTEDILIEMLKLIYLRSFSYSFNHCSLELMDPTQSLPLYNEKLTESFDFGKKDLHFLYEYFSLHYHLVHIFPFLLENAIQTIIAHVDIPQSWDRKENLSIIRHLHINVSLSAYQWFGDLNDHSNFHKYFIKRSNLPFENSNTSYNPLQRQLIDGLIYAFLLDSKFSDFLLSFYQSNFEMEKKGFYYLPFYIRPFLHFSWENVQNWRNMDIQERIQWLRSQRIAKNPTYYSFWTSLKIAHNRSGNFFQMLLEAQQLSKNSTFDSFYDLIENCSHLLTVRNSSLSSQRHFDELPLSYSVHLKDDNPSNELNLAFFHQFFSQLTKIGDSISSFRKKNPIKNMTLFFTSLYNMLKREVKEFYHHREEHDHQFQDVKGIGLELIANHNIPDINSNQLISFLIEMSSIQSHIFQLIKDHQININQRKERFPRYHFPMISDDILHHYHLTSTQWVAFLSNRHLLNFPYSKILDKAIYLINNSHMYLDEYSRLHNLVTFISCQLVNELDDAKFTLR